MPLRVMDRLFAPQWAGGWTAARVCYALVALYAHLPRLIAIPDAYAAPDMTFSRAPLDLGEVWLMSVPSATAVWAIAAAGLFLLLYGGRAAKPGLALWLVFGWLFMSAEALNIKAYDRLMTWIALAMLLAPVGEHGLERKWRSPVGRWALLLVYVAIYGSTGFLKATRAGHGWATGEVLAYHLVHPWFGSFPLGTWASDKVWITAPASWYTVLFECSFPFLVWFRRTNPWILLMGAGMHLGILALMYVGPFSLVSVSVYPALLHPEVARGLWERWGQRLTSRRTPDGESPSAT